MLRYATFGFFALLFSADAFSVTLVPIQLTSISQTVTATVSLQSPVTATDPMNAVVNWTASTTGLSGTGTSQAQVAGGVFYLSNQGSATTTAETNFQAINISGAHTLQLNVPDFGSSTTSIVFTITQQSSQLSGFTGGGEVVLGNDGSSGSYFSSILNSSVILPSPLGIRIPGIANGAGGASSAVEAFLAGDTVQLPLTSATEYDLNSANTSGSYSETFAVHAFAVEPTSVPEPSTDVLVGAGLLLLGLHLRRINHVIAR